MANEKLTDLTPAAATMGVTDIIEATVDPTGTPLTRSHTGQEVVDMVNAAQGVLHVRDQQTSGTNGGGTTAGATAIRVLNTTGTNTITGASLGSNQITLPAGTYNINASAPAYKTSRHKIHLYNITDAAVEIVGTSEFSITTDSTITRSMLMGQFTIPATEVFEIRHYTQQTSASIGFGTPTSNGLVEVYTEVFITKV